MVESRESYQVFAGDLEQLLTALNFVLARVADRLDGIEGHKGNPKFFSTQFDFSSGISGVLKASAAGTDASFGALSASDVADHDHTSASEGGDYSWADFVAADVTYLQTLVAGLAVADLIAKAKANHNHTSATEGGDYPWADFVAADVTYLQALLADITQTNLLDKSADETITGDWIWSDKMIQIKDANGTVLHQFGE